MIADVASQRDAPNEVRSYDEDWLIRAYGRSFAELFRAIYTEKYHATPAANMITDWIGPCMHRASLGKMLREALSPATRNVYYVTDCRYPPRAAS